MIIDNLVDTVGAPDGFLGALLGASLGVAFYPLTRRIERLICRAGSSSAQEDPPGSS